MFDQVVTETQWSTFTVFKDDVAYNLEGLDMQSDYRLITEHSRYKLNRIKTRFACALIYFHFDTMVNM